MAQKKSLRIGRPPKPAGEKFETKARQLGRVSDDDWHTLQAAAKASGETFTAWALSKLLPAAKRQLRQS
jgi:uncharacterized protein (DUF1778 family)